MHATQFEDVDYDVVKAEQKRLLLQLKNGIVLSDDYRIKLDHYMILMNVVTWNPDTKLWELRLEVE
jgi:hypothetical protein